MNLFQTIIRKIKSVILIIGKPNSINLLSDYTLRNFKQIIIYLKNKKIFTYYTPLQIKFVCIPESETSINIYLNNKGYENVEISLCYQWLQKGDCCLDLGANLGYFSAVFADGVGQEGTVISVEASPKTACLLKQAIQTLHLEQVYLEESCVSNQDGSVIFMTSRENDSSDVSQSLQVDPERKYMFQEVEIPSITLNSLIEKHRIHDKISLVKMDIEAAEPMALQGGSILFNTYALPLFIIEVYTPGLQRLSYTPRDIFKFFQPELFDLYQINRSYPNLNPKVEVGKVYPLRNPETYNWPCHTNLIAVPKTGKFAYRKQHIMSYLN